MGGMKLAPASGPPTSCWYSPRSAPSTGHRWPVPWPLGAHGRPSTRAIAVPVAVVALPAVAAGGGALDGRVDDRDAVHDRRVVRGQLAEADELEEPGVDDRALVERRAAVPDVVADGRVRVARLGEADEVGARRQGPVGRDRPALDRALVVVGDTEVHPRRRRIAVLLGDVGGRDEAGDLGRDRGRGVAALLLPALDAEGRPVADEVVGGRPDVVRVAAAARPGHRHAGRVRHQDRVGRLVELGAERIGRGLAIDQAVARHGPVGELLAVEEEVERVARGRQVAVSDKARPRLVEVAGEDLAVRAEVGVGRVAGGDGLTPWRGEPGDDRAGERLVLGGLDHVGGRVVLGDEPRRIGVEQAPELPGGVVQGRVVLRPAGRVGLAHGGEAPVDRALGSRHRLRLG